MIPTSPTHDDDNDDNDHHDMKLPDDHEVSRDSTDRDPIEISNDNKENDDKVEEEEDEEEEHDEDDGHMDEEEDVASPDALKKPRSSNGRAESDLMRFADSIRVEEAVVTDPEILAQIELIETSTPQTPLEIALSNAIKRKTIHLNRVTAEIAKLKNFISKRKQTYKRKRKDDGAPTRALSAYNIFIQERFALLAKENEKALKSENEDITLKRVPPAHLVAATGNVWKTLSQEEKQKYEERYVSKIKYVLAPIFELVREILTIFAIRLVQKVIDNVMKRKWQNINDQTNKQIGNVTKRDTTCSFHRMYYD
jgi:hypothetical protein